MTNETMPDCKIVFHEYDNVFLAHQIQLVALSLIFATLVVALRYTLHNIEAKKKNAKKSAAD